MFVYVLLFVRIFLFSATCLFMGQTVVLLWLADEKEKLMMNRTDEQLLNQCSSSLQIGSLLTEVAETIKQIIDRYWINIVLNCS